ncbi:serine/threonine-protein kinase [Paenibacillus sp. GCM10012307]|uniref:Serine/threonine protein kinase n=1 Tax=Paenibacillus roseus TaxID=2798579 RepID=A0A934J2N6_9BACL|nr:serine/threonine-protein kinase [Paenibacillus roseus]MBJ6363662.1 serine/threonine protein kinase [Paenibacillus roseus]
MHTQWEQGMIVNERYKIAGIAGQGGMGTVYMAEDLRLPGKRWALKRMAKPQGASGHLREARLLMKLYHPCLPGVADYFEWDEGREAVLVTEYLEGCTLREYCSQRGLPLPMPELLPIAIQLAGVLDYLHRQTPPVIHRDLKPSNIMIEAGGTIKLIDFGIARSFRWGASEDTQWLGTPGFAAPEQSGGAQTDARTDIFGLGALIYYLMFGHIYSQGASNPQTTTASRQFPDLSTLLTRMLSPDPEHRPSSAAEVSESLVTFQHSYMRIVGASSASDITRPRGKRVVVASLGQGSGATFITLTLAKLLLARCTSCVAVEHPLHKPEWRALLAFSGRPQRSRLGLQAEPLGYELWKEDRTRWYTLAYSGRDVRDSSSRLERLLDYQTEEAEVTLIDISGHWRSPECAALLDEADYVLFVADPWVSKWGVNSIDGYSKIAEGRSRRGLLTSWLANKDMEFPQRRQWMGLLPTSPVACVPQLAFAAWTQCLWEGRWATDYPRWKRELQLLLHPVIDQFIQ